MPKVSVIIPTYNRVDFLPQAVQSVLDQDYQDFEILVVDDGSTDGTVGYCRTISDPRIHFYFQPNAGLSAARNTGIAHAQGEYLALLDSDDIFLPGKLSLQVGQLDEDQGLGLVTGGFHYIDLAGRVIAERRSWAFRPSLDLETLLIGAPIITNAVLLRSHWVREVGGFNPSLRRVEDLDLWLRMGVTGCRMAWTPAVVCAYRMHPNQMVRDASEQTRVTIQVFEAFYQREPLPQQALKLKPLAFASAHLGGACREFGVGQVREGAESLREAFRLDPGLLEGDPPRLESIVVSWAADPVTMEPAAFMQAFFAHLPDELESLKRYQARFSLMASITASLDALWVGRKELARDYLVQSLHLEALYWQRPVLPVKLLINQLMNFPLENQQRLIETWFDIFPARGSTMRRLKHKAVGRWFMTQGFKAQACGDAKVGELFFSGVRYDPSWLLNWGVLVSLGRYSLHRIWTPFGRAQ